MLSTITIVSSVNESYMPSSITIFSSVNEWYSVMLAVLMGGAGRFLF